MNKAVNDIVDLLLNKNNFLIVVHESPDGDAIGSMLALNGILKLCNKKVKMFSKHRIALKLQFLYNWEEICYDFKEVENNHYDAMIMLDCGARDRAGGYVTNFKNYDTLINIDHHASNDNFGDLNYIDLTGSSTGEHVYFIVKEIVKRFDMNKIPYGVATALLVALYDDTGGMRYISTTSRTLTIAAELVDSGANCSVVSENLFFSISKEKMKLTSRVISRLAFAYNDKIAYCIMTLDDLKETGARPEDSEGLIDFPRAIEGVEVSILLKEVDNDKYKLSFRSRGLVDVNEYCSTYGGGGHKAAAGCTIRGKAENIIEKIIEELKLRLP